MHSRSQQQPKRPATFQFVVQLSRSSGDTVRKLANQLIFSFEAYPEKKMLKKHHEELFQPYRFFKKVPIREVFFADGHVGRDGHQQLTYLREKFAQEMKSVEVGVCHILDWRLYSSDTTESLASESAPYFCFAEIVQTSSLD